MKKNRYELIDKEPWYKNYPSPMAKWMYNLSVLGFCWFGKTGGMIWFVFFNPAIVILYITVAILFGFMYCGAK